MIRTNEETKEGCGFECDCGNTETTDEPKNFRAVLKQVDGGIACGIQCLKCGEFQSKGVMKGNPQRLGQAMAIRVE